MSPAVEAPVVVWFRLDLRLRDHAALTAAAATGRPVIPLYILDDAGAGPWAMGGAARWWLHHSLTSLGADLARLGTRLVLRRGRASDVLRDIVAETGAVAVHAGRAHEPWARQAEAEVAVPLTLHRTATLFDFDAIRTKTGGVYGVYTPFARACRALAAPHAPGGVPAFTGATAASDTLADWGLLPTRPDWSGGFAWEVGEDAAHRRLDAFLKTAVGAYGTGRNLPGQPGTSMISPHLHWGELSPHQVWHTARLAADATGEGLETFLGEILWREFSAYVLWHQPHLPDRPLRPAFAALPTRAVPAELRAWRRGRTGVPIVDAGMRQLWHTGWMHNRVRMIAASFLVKNLLAPWQAGSAHFWDTLVDADLASNSAGWQWIAGCGIDSQPFFRVFNPVSQGEKFDPDGAYVRRWVPELAGVPAAEVHRPGAGGYAAPIVDLATSRVRALAAYRDTVRSA